MNDSPQAEIPDFAQLAADPEIAALLDFEPVPRKIDVPGGWTPDKQREVIARLAVHGSPNRACDEMGKHRTGLTKVYKSPGAASFRAAWAGAVELATRRRDERARADLHATGAAPPSLDHRRRHKPDEQAGPLPGQIRNEHGEWEDEESIRQRVADARDSISAKLLRCRRLYLREIGSSPGKRAAFEILTRLPIDWDKAARLEAQDDEPWRKPNMRSPDMLLTAENGWLGGLAHGEDKIAELREAVDKYREEAGLPPTDWEGEESCVGAIEQSATTGDPPAPHRPSRARPSDHPSSTAQGKPGPRLRSL